MWGWIRVAGAWTGEGNQQIVTAMLPRAPGTGPESELRDVRQITAGHSGRGFAAVTPDGSMVQYVSTSEPDDELVLGPVRIRGEALLLCGRAGLALGCRALNVGGKPIEPPAVDFEFEVADAALARATPIYRPIDPVHIGPEQNVFTDEVEVALSSRTPGVEIRYTTDGRDPTPQSPHYRGPLKLTSSAVVKARAYRAGVTENPPQLSGTHATVASTAMFDKVPILEAEKYLKTKPGLQCRYWEDDWKKLWLGIDELPPRATGLAADLWDFSLVPADNRPLGARPAPRARYYALEYSGYLDVPADGVYTLHAPHECVWPDTNAGYELRVYLGRKIDPRTRWKVGLNEWYPSTRLHALGNWSIALGKGPHPLRIVWIDYRTDAPQRLNRPGLTDYIWSGVAPELRISGPGLDRRPIPAAWLRHVEPTKK